MGSLCDMKMRFLCEAKKTTANGAYSRHQIVTPTRSQSRIPCFESLSSALQNAIIRVFQHVWVPAIQIHFGIEVASKNPKSKKQTAPRACPKYLTTSFERSTYNYQNCWCPNMNSSCPWSKMKFRVTPYKIVVASGCILFQYSASTPYDFIRVTNPYDATELYSQIPTPTLLDFSRITPKPSRTQVSVPVSVSVMAATEKKKK